MKPSWAVSWPIGFVALLACSASPKPPSIPSSSGVQMDSPSPNVIQSKAAPSGVRPIATATTPEAAKRKPGGLTKTGESASASLQTEAPTVRDLLTKSANVGKTVRIAGLCLGYGALAEGSPPNSRSDWQLAQDDVAIYVVGPLPGGCAPNGPATAVTIKAIVRQDTLPANPVRPKRPRRYLELLALSR